MHDAHFHFSKEIGEYQMQGICNVENEEEYKLVQPYSFHKSCGIHPWHVDTVSYDSFLPYLEKAKIIGEIGLDNTWCTTDLQLQKEVFEKQLQYASLTHKPVILHLKGMEKEALSFISKYKNTYIVHWYSCMEYVEDYIDLGCYFTIGPSVGIDESVNQVVEKVDLDHLLIESDGIAAIQWAFNTDSVDYIACLKRSIQIISDIKKKSIQETEQILDSNFNTLFNTL